MKQITLMLPSQKMPRPVRHEADTLGECGRPSGLMLWFWLGAAVFGTTATGCAAARPGAEEHAVEVRQLNYVSLHLFSYLKI